MKYYFIIALLVCGLKSFFVYGQSSPKSSGEDNAILLQLETNWLKAEFTLDTTYLSSIIDTSFVDISEEGIHNKKQALVSMYNNISKRLKDSIIIDSFNLENAVVNIYNDMAVVIFYRSHIR
jgi:hypothetical protein